MQIVHIKRSFIWGKELLFTLFIFWSKHPQHTWPIMRFIIKKAISLPRFLKRNVATESTTKDYSQLLNETINLYNKYKDSFEPTDPKSYKKLTNLLTNKLQIIYFLIRKTKPNLIIETGVAAGESSGLILQALNDNKKGKLISIDLPFQWYTYGANELHLDSLPPGKMPGYIIPKRLHKNWELVLGDTYQKLPEIIKKNRKIDVFLHDSEHTDKTMTFEYQTAWPSLKKNGMLLSDDIDFTKAFQNFTKSQKIRCIDFKNFGISFKK